LSERCRALPSALRRRRFSTRFACGRSNFEGLSMRTRHRMPMIFSLSMMDVFCCTLGCVILLWLINQREAMLRTKSAQEALEQLTDARATLADTSGQRDSLQRQLNSAQTDLSSVQRQSDALRADLAAARVRADELLKQLGIQ